ncbi:metallophosphoesterase [Enterococcus sp.]|jgi:putative phosphoesterase|uniref:metallophosphoesterase n=1 Tax=Enterococcus sp. TaxID=35783 RepID=UPI0025B9D4FB|nr:metallophosphoesterase [Enterococcus sp.]
MGKLAVISDLHVDINHFSETELQLIAELLTANQATHLHLAGDMANKVATAKAVVAFFQKQLPTTFHWGNHEMADLPADLIETYPDPAFLNFQTVALSENTLLLGVNGWYDYGYSDLQSPEEILRLKQLFWYDRMIQRTGTDPKISHQINQRLRQTLQGLPSEKEIIVATHFVPKAAFIVKQTGKYIRWNHLNAFLGSPEFGAVIDEMDNVRQVVFGHTHRRFEDQVIGQTIYSCRPLGYYYEWQLTRRFVLENQLAENFQPTKLRGLLRANQAAFDQYKAAHLKDELQQAITWINY